ncbi:HK97 family phage prohead protease [Moraxella catarrhalis]|uniref:HK97 family phage prohead protease n=1 Tax=Moraxella catarrhalis TaxID=480 RepID=UPI000202A446|nr:HK97 family phage prohead protease [Moraxella catarrhalis]AKI26996.1 coat protein [Moraxella phage Mcat1]AKI27048.1 coat protein [Moraxella phage Mcat2]EGE18883.1 peptidase U35, phage prohead HK97 [Moraxella catarrhalis BC8]MPX09243.1 peptidase U35 [Moraxella catarrhalis]MPX17341.1 peptidase U35 [Moraxella catarrhalis]
MTKAYSTLQIKSVTDNDDERIITGIATTPSTDRDDDILEPLGAKFTLPIPLLSHHNHSQPIGEVIQAEVTAGGILITAKIAKIDEEGKLKERIDEAWQSIKSGLIKGLSVGFKIKEYSYIENSWGLHIKEWEWWELSIVTIPANGDAVITSVKQIKEAFSLPLQPTPNPPINPIVPPPTPTTITKATPSNGAVALILPKNGVALV